MRKVFVTLLFIVPISIGFLACTLWAGIEAGWQLGIDFGRWLTRDAQDDAG